VVARSPAYDDPADKSLGLNRLPSANPVGRCPRGSPILTQIGEVAKQNPLTIVSRRTYGCGAPFHPMKDDTVYDGARCISHLTAQSH